LTKSLLRFPLLTTVTTIFDLGQ
ncbi:unnamed protein product, partial [Allacma fusca]